MVYSSLHFEDYTWKNALLWGNFAQHCKRATRGSLGNRVVHLVIAVIEFFPIIGQIASIFEKTIANSVCKQSLFYKGHRLNSISNESPEIVSLLDELCEKKGEVSCSDERFSEIIEQLKNQNKLHLLNTIPKCLIEYTTWANIALGDVSRTPLHYWAQKGHIEAVKILIKHGAQDNFIDHPMTGIFLAAFNGHDEVVEYLLNNGSHVDVACFDDVLKCFVPMLIKDMIRWRRFDNIDKALNSIRLILSDLKNNNPLNLAFQLKIPVIEETDYHQNIFDWIQIDELKDSSNLFHETSEHTELLSQLLLEFGAHTQEVFSKRDLKAQFYNIGKFEETLGTLAVEGEK